MAYSQSVPGAKRMVMGHTIQSGINAACDGQAIRIDVGMSRGCGNGSVEVLEIRDDGKEVCSSELCVVCGCRWVALSSLTSFLPLPHRCGDFERDISPCC